MGRRRRTARLGATALSILALSCSSPDNPLAPGGRPAAVAIEVTPGSALMTALGASQTFRAIVRDANGNPMANVSIRWSSDDPSVATVDDAGEATAVGDGEATVTAEAAGLTASAALTVSATIKNTARVSAVDQLDLASGNDSATATLTVTVEK